MTLDQIIILGILFAVLTLLIWGKWRYDVISLIALFSLALAGLIPASKIFSGFGHPATILVAIVLIVSYGLNKSGVVQTVSQYLSSITSRPSINITILIFITALFSMFMNNIAALSLMMPVAIQAMIKSKKPPSAILMPLSFGSMLGGLVTMIGTPSNIIIATYREKVTGEAFSMFDFAPVGGIVALTGLLFITLIGWRLIKPRKSSSVTELFDIEDYLFEVRIDEESPLIGMKFGELDKELSNREINLLSLTLFTSQRI